MFVRYWDVKKAATEGEGSIYHQYDAEYASVLKEERGRLNKDRDDMK